MYLLRVLSLTFFAGVLVQTGPVTEPHETLELRQQDPAPSIWSEQSNPDPGQVLDTLLALIKIETASINSTISRYPDPLSDLQQKLVTAVIGVKFTRITELIQNANDILKSTVDNDEKVDIDSGPPGGGGDCGKICMSQKTTKLVKEVGHTTLSSVLKVGLGALGKFIHPAFLVLSGFVLTVNTIVGGALVVLSALVNGVLLAIAGGIAYLGHLASEKERQMTMGGPQGPTTKGVAQMLEALGRAVG